MRKLFVPLLAVALLSSCNDDAPALRVRHFSYEINGTPMTRSVETQAVVDAISASLPESVTIYLTSQTDGKVYNCKTSDGIVLPSDLYRVIGTHSAGATLVVDGSSKFTLSPSFSIDCSVEVTDDEDEYTISGTYKSLAFVVDTTETEGVYVPSKSEAPLPMLISGDAGIVFFQGKTDGLQIAVRPKDTERFKETIYTLSNNVSAGYFYMLHPTAGGIQPKIFPIGLPDFVEGSL